MDTLWTICIAQSLELTIGENIRKLKTSRLQNTNKLGNVMSRGNGTTHQTPGKDHFWLKIQKTLKKHLYIILVAKMYFTLDF